MPGGDLAYRQACAQCTSAPGGALNPSEDRERDGVSCRVSACVENESRSCMRAWLTCVCACAYRRLVIMLIRIGSEYIAPHPLHAVLDERWIAVLATNRRDPGLLPAASRLPRQSSRQGAMLVQLGWARQQRTVSCGIYASSTRGEYLPALPASAGSAAQQCDLPASVGPIARIKIAFRKLMRKQHRAALMQESKGGDIREIAGLLEQAARHGMAARR